MSRRRARGLAVGLGFLLAFGADADLLIQEDGKEFEGELVAVDAAGVRFRAQGGEELALARRAVARVELYRDLSGTTAQRVDELDDPVLREALRYVAAEEQYPSAGAVNLYLGHQVTFEADWTRRTRVRNVVRVLQERGKGEGTVETSFLRGLDTLRFDFGRTLMPDGALKGLSDKGVRVAPVHAAHPEYDRLMKQVQTLPGVDVGRVVDWQYSVDRRPDDPAVPPWYRQVIRLGEPVMRGLVEVRLHRDLEADVVLSRTEGVSRRRHQEGEYLVETFEYVGLEPGKREDQRPPGEEIYPTVYVAPRRTWAQLSGALIPLVEAARRPGPLAAALLKQLVPAGGDADAVYQSLALWVAREVRLVGVAMESAGYAPRGLEEVLATRTGNFLDKTMALYALLRAAGVDAELYLARDRYLSPLPPGVQSLHLFDDALVRVRLSTGWAFRTADDEDMGPHVLPATFYGVAALRISGPEPAAAPLLVEAPPLEVDLALVRFPSTLAPDGTLEGERDLLVRGNAASTVRTYRNLSGEELQRRMEQLNHGFDPRAELVSYDLENLGDFTRDPVYRRRFRVPGYALRAGGKLLAFHMPGLVDSSADVGTSTRQHALAYRDRELRETEIAVVLPPGAKVLHLPEDLVVRGEGYAYEGRFERAEGEVRYHGRAVRDAFRISPEVYPAYRRMREERARQALQWVVVEMVE